MSTRSVVLAAAAGTVLAGFVAVSADPIPGGGAPRKMKAVRSAPVAPPVPAELRIYRTLQKRVTVEYNSVPLFEVIRDLAAQSHLNLIIDPRGLKEENIAADVPVTVAGTNIRLATLLDQIVTPLHLDYTVSSDGVRITDRQRAKGELSTVTYPIGDLIMRIENGRNAVDGDAVQNLIDSITSTIVPDTWDEPDGPGAVTFADKTNSLVIRQSPDAQREIQAWLARLRQERSSPTIRRSGTPSRGNSMAPRVEAPLETADP